ncbi:MAG: polysaccharide deacetylase, partial [Prevotella sp.]|nr:polysaccharide deacetylase [Prevotella sp.]
HHLDYAYSLQGQLWIATFHDVSAYKAERENIQLTVKEKKHKITVKPHLTLDKSLFHHPLTLIFNTDRSVRVKQDGKPIDVIHKDGKAVFNFNPHGGKITIRLL